MAPTSLPRVVLAQSENEHIRRSLRVLHMLNELHKAGYQLLRACPGMNASGSAWRCTITPVTNVCSNHGAFCAGELNGPLATTYSSAQENDYFDWTDATNDNARELAAKFIERFPRIVQAGHGRDWLYVGWYAEMLGRAENEDLPMAYADFMGEPRFGFLPTTEHYFDSTLILPPPGLSQTKCEFEYVRGL